MNFFHKLFELIRAVWARIMAHYRSEEVDHAKKDFYNDFSGGREGGLTLPSPEAPRGKRASRWVSFLVLLGIIAVMAVLFYRVMAAFFLPLFLAMLLTVIFRPLYLWFLHRLGGYKQICAGLTTAIVLVIVLAPLAWAATLAIKEGMQVVAGIDVTDFEQRLQRVRKMAGLDMQYIKELNGIDDILTELLAPETTQTMEFQQSKLNDARKLLQTLRSQAPGELLASIDGQLVMLEMKLQTSPEKMVPQSELQDALIIVEQLKQTITGGPINNWLTQQANPSEEQIRGWRRQSLDFVKNNFVSATGATTGFVIKLVVGLIIMIVSLYFFLSDGKALLGLLMNLSPLDEIYERELLMEFDRVSRAVVVATILSALVQALLAGMGFWFVGMDSVFLLMMLTFVLAMVPFVGAASVWVPVSAYLWIYEERMGAAIFIFLFGMLIVSLSDNVIKPLVLHGQSRIHPLLALLSILGGVQALGPIGIFVGPMVVAFLQTLLKLLHREMVTLDESEGGRPPTSDAGKQKQSATEEELNIDNA